MNDEAGIERMSHPSRSLGSYNAYAHDGPRRYVSFIDSRKSAAVDDVRVSM